MLRNYVLEVDLCINSDGLFLEIFSFLSLLLFCHRIYLMLKIMKVLISVRNSKWVFHVVFSLELDWGLAIDMEINHRGRSSLRKVYRLKWILLDSLQIVLAFHVCRVHIMMPRWLVHLDALIVICVEKMLHLYRPVCTFVLLVFQRLFHSYIKSFRFLLVNQRDRVDVLARCLRD